MTEKKTEFETNQPPPEEAQDYANWVHSLPENNPLFPSKADQDQHPFKKGGPFVSQLDKKVF